MVALVLQDQRLDHIRTRVPPLRSRLAWTVHEAMKEAEDDQVQAVVGAGLVVKTLRDGPYCGIRGAEVCSYVLTRKALAYTMQDFALAFVQSRPYPGAQLSHCQIRSPKV
jgi:hypothetical protein